MKPTLLNLTSITEILLADESSYQKIRDACTDLLNLFYQVSVFDRLDPVNDTHLQSSAGLSVSPEAAAFCIRDIMRTRTFMRGLKKAVEVKLQEDPKKAVTVLYAGTGPFATLLLPLVSFFDATQLKMLLLDINPASITYLKRIISYFNLQPYVLQVVETDAVTYQIAGEHKPDIILSETMRPSLKKEPQISIVTNLVAQCPVAVLIPEMIEITVALWSSRHDQEKKLIPLQPIFNFNKTTALQIAAKQNKPDNVFPLISVQVEQPPEPYWSRLALLTNIQVFNDEVLLDNNSSLSLPEFAYDLHTVKTWPTVFHFQYQIFPVPGFKITPNVNSCI